jgi:hypothetical protein
MAEKKFILSSDLKEITKLIKCVFKASLLRVETDVSKGIDN